jgi:hypothetical protein
MTFEQFESLKQEIAKLYDEQKQPYLFWKALQNRARQYRRESK